jgi:hypothetical protein
MFVLFSVHSALSFLGLLLLEDFLSVVQNIGKGRSRLGRCLRDVRFRAANCDKPTQRAHERNFRPFEWPTAIRVPQFAVSYFAQTPALVLQSITTSGLKGPLDE